MLVGYRTYILVGLGIVVCGLNGAGVIDDHTRDWMLSVLGFGSIATLRSALAHR